MDLEKLDLLGINYISEFIIFSYNEKKEHDNKTEYILTCLWAISNQKGITKTYSELVRINNTPQSSRTGDEIVKKFRENINKSLKKGGD